MTKLEQLTERLSKAKQESAQFSQVEMDEAALVRLCLLCSRLCLPKKGKLSGVQALALQQSLEHLKGHKHSFAVIYKNIYRVLANWKFIKEGMRIPEWNGEPDTADIIFIGVKVVPAKDGELPKYRALIRLKTGLGAGIITGVALTTNAMSLFLDRVSGCSTCECPLEEIAGMQTRAVISMKDDRALIHSWECTQEQKKKNRELAELRSDFNKCSRHDMCNTCKKTIEECPLAVWLPDEGEIDGEKIAFR